MKPEQIKLIYRPVIGRAALAGLAGRNRDRTGPARGRFTRADVQEILAQVWEKYDRLAPEVPKQPTLGNQMNLYFSCVTVCCLQTLLEQGIERNYAIKLISDLAWKVYEKWGAIPVLLARFRNRGRREQLRFAVNTFLRFPFSPPGYRWERLPSDEGISFDIKRCVVAEYFRAKGAANLCVGTYGPWTLHWLSCGAAGSSGPNPRGRRSQL